MKTEVKERPIIFSTQMVQAILAGTKTQTRRLVKAYYQDYDSVSHYLTPNVFDFHYEAGAGEIIKCPYGDPGDVLYVKETFREYNKKVGYNPCMYKADYTSDYAASMKWKSPRFMPKDASRIRLLIENVRVERLNNISEDDAIDEGIEPMGDGWKSYGIIHTRKHKGELHPFSVIANESPIQSYMELWESLHGPNSWPENPWVWVITFKVLES